MRWYTRRRPRTICLSLAFVTVFLHLLLALVSLSIFNQPCDTDSPPKVHSLRTRANGDYKSIWDVAKPPLDTNEMNPSKTDTKLEQKILSTTTKMVNKAVFEDLSGKERPGVSLIIDDKDSLMKKSENASLTTAAKMGRYSLSLAEGSDVSKLEALFSHPLYNMPSLPIPEDDWLLKVKPKVKASEKSSQMWVSASEDGYEDVQWNSSRDSHPPWLRFHLGISRWELYPRRDPNMDLLTQQLATHRIVSAVQKSGGTQLKLVMSFPNYGQAMFKPMKQERDEETNYNLYYFSDFERHNAEIAAFHLDRILGYRRIPPAVGRLVDVVKEIKDITTDHKLVRTFFTSPVGNMCFYGQCSYYCSTEHAVCGRPQALEASLAVMLPDLSLATRRSWRSPWRRSYSRSKLAKWETEPDYCATVKKTPPYNKGTRMVDFIDMVILDFLMSRFTL